MKAAVCHQFGRDLAIEDVHLAPPGPCDVKVDVKACAICHSDIAFAAGAWGGTLPAVYGHEAAGIVMETGGHVSTVRPGDHVVVTLIRSCGDCHYCRSGSMVVCDEVFDLDRKSPISGSDGQPYEQAMRTGAFAETIVVRESQMVPVDKDIAFDCASLLACGAITGYGAVVHTAKVQPGQTVAIIGCGGVGLNAIQSCVIAGASTIIAVDLTADKLAAARDFGATHPYNSATDDVAEAVRELTEGRGVDFVFVTVGVRSAFESAFELITKNGAVVIVGMPPSGVLAEYDPGTMAAWNQKILGSKMGEADIRKDIPHLIALYRQGAFRLDELISGRYALPQINEAIAEVKAGRALRNIIVFD